MGKNNKNAAEKFDAIFGGDELDPNADFDTSGFGDIDFEEKESFNFDENDTSAQNLSQFAEEEFDEDYEQGEYLPVKSDENSGSSNILSKAVSLAQENKIATAGVGLAAVFGLWKLFGPKKQEQQASVQQGSPNSYEDEFLDLDDEEEDSIDTFINEQKQVNPMFTPLRFK